MVSLSKNNAIMPDRLLHMLDKNPNLMDTALVSAISVVQHGVTAKINLLDP